jgi:hypothetical protein
MSCSGSWVSSGTPSCIIAVGLMGVWVSAIGPFGLMCCMALSASEVCHLTVDKLTKVYSERRVDSSGPVRALR